MPVCWCGNEDLVAFGGGYSECSCGTLVRELMPASDITRVGDDERGLYGKDYWFSHQQELGLPTLEQRALTDLGDRGGAWLDTVLAYKRPPGRVLEIGAAHGGFVALLTSAGFDATGVELSPWVVDYAARTSNVAMMRGPLEDLALAPGSFDLIVAFDVLEHLPDPLATITCCASLLAGDGLLIVQTPSFPRGSAHEAVRDQPFGGMLIDEHLFLFSEASARELLAQAGLPASVSVASVFPTDMTLVAGRVPPRHLTSLQQSAPLTAIAPASKQEQRIAVARSALSRVLHQVESDKRRLSGALVALRAVAADFRNSRSFGRRILRLFDDPRAKPASARPEVIVRQWTLAAPPVRGGAGAIAVDLTAIQPGGTNGGAKLVALEIVRQLARLAPKRDWLLLTSPSSHAELAALDAANVRRRLIEPTPTALSDLLEEQPIAALLCPMSAPPFDDPRVPLVCLINDLQFMTYPDFFDDVELQGRTRALERVARSADWVFTPCDYVRESVLRHSALPPDRVTAVPYSFAPHRLEAPPAEQVGSVLERYGVERHRYFVYPANFWPHKNHSMLLVAFALFSKRHPELAIRLVLPGANRPDPQALQRNAARMGLANHVLVPGYVPDADLAALLAGACALVFPSLYEGFGLPILEAYAVGCPVACSDVTSLPEVANGAALMFDPRKPEAIATALERLATEPALRAELSRRGHERLAALRAPEDEVRRYLQAIEVVAAAARRPNDELTGVHGDRWTAARFIVAHAGGAAELELELENPRASAVTVSAPGTEPISLAALQVLALRCVLPAAPGVVELVVAPTYRPSEHGASSDRRALGVRVRSCRLTRAGAEVDLLAAGRHV